MNLPPFMPLARHVFSPMRANEDPYLFSSEHYFNFQPSKEDRSKLVSSWLAVEEVGPEACHELGRVIEDNKNAAYLEAKNIEHDPRFMYLGYYAVPEVCVATLVADHHLLTVKRAPENGNYSHFHVEITEATSDNGQRTPKALRAADRALIYYRLLRMLEGPFLAHSDVQEEEILLRFRSLPLGSRMPPEGEGLVSSQCRACLISWPEPKVN